MKRNLEQNFKDAFEEYELPYNSGAWTALSDKLDKLQGTPTKVTPSNNWKWISGVAVLAIITTTAIVFTTDNNENKPANTSIAENKTTTVENNSTVMDKATSDNSTKATESAETITNATQENVPVKRTNSHNTSNTELTEHKKPNENVTVLDGKQQNTPIIPFVNPLDFVNKDKIYFPEIAEVCEGSVVAIPNKNKTAITLVSPSGKKTEIKASSSIYFTLTESGTYSFVAKNHSETASFNVKEAPKVDFTIDMGEIYEDGIPSIVVQSLTEGHNLVWSFEGSTIKQKGTQAKAHFYKKGVNEVTLTAKGTNGCEASISKEITIDEDYNLLAMNAFYATGDNPTTNHFIPKALLYRNTEFKMYIIEPRSGVVIFETNSLEGWNGINTTTNQLVEENKSFIWKVVLANPEPEEKREYKGIVTRL